VREYLAKHDPSHDFSHVERVLINALKIMRLETVRDSTL